MDCTQIRNRLSEYRDGSLDTASRVAIASHLRGCGECAAVDESLDAVRRNLRALPPASAPPELLARILAAVDAESGTAGAASSPAGTGARRSFLARFRVPIEVAAAVLLIASGFWYRNAAPPVPGPPPTPIAQAPKTISRAEVIRDASPDAAGGSSSGTPIPRTRPRAAKEEAPAAKPRAWTAADLPAAPAIRASSNSERIVPAAPPAEPESKREEPAGAAAGSPAFEGGRGAEAVRTRDAMPPRVFAAPSYRLHRPLPYGRDVSLNVEPGDRAGAEDRIAAAAIRRGGLVERIEREGGPGADDAPGMVRVILPEAAAAEFLEELGRIGTLPPGGAPASVDLPAGPRPGTVAYAVRIRVR